MTWKMHFVTILAAAASAMPVAAAQLAERVTGEGLVHPQSDAGYTYTLSVAVAAFEDENGRVWGTVTARTDGTCTSGQQSSPCTITAQIDCLDIQLNEAWIYAVVTHTERDGVGGCLVGPGLQMAVYIRDLGPDATDLMYLAWPESYDTTCALGCGSPFPTTSCCAIGLPADADAKPLESGGFTIRRTGSKPKQPAVPGTWSLVKRLYQDANN